MIKINIATEYTKTPGGRFSSEGEYSGEDFRDKMLLPKYMEAVEKKEKLIINLDGGYGYGSSFLEEAFGGMARKFKDFDISKLEIISDEEPQLINDILNYISDAKKFQERKNSEKS